MDWNSINWAQVWSIVVVIIDYGIKIVAVGTVPENRSPSSSSAWLLIILLVPIVGLPLYLLIGSPYLRGKRREIQAYATRALAGRLEPDPDYPPGFTAPPGVASIARGNRELTSFPMITGHCRRVLPTDVSFDEMAAAVEAAQHTVHAEFYIMSWDSVTDRFCTALTDAAARGVTVRVLFDQLGSQGYPEYKKLQTGLTAAGVQWHAMMPLHPLRGQWRRPDLRNHRKLLIVDDEVAFMGSMNMIDPTYLKAKNRRRNLHWLDLNVEVSGPIVAQLAQVFALDWFQETEELVRDRDDEAASAHEHSTMAPMQLVPSGPGFRTEPNLRMFVGLVNLAQRELDLVSPYFVPDEALMLAITTAAQRGVRVRLYASERGDQFMVHHAQQSYYDALLEAGVHIHLYRAPTILHTKLMVVDNQLAVIGSSNMDMRSFFLDFEVSLFAVDPEMIHDLESVLQDYRDNSFELMLSQWRKRSVWVRYTDNVMRLTSAVM
ncbi:phospholipase D-like domain-containing protein [Enemella evansiae]|uniref:Cardiolipin synthase A n=2 Tax=Enemella evansiae TaxID=2016499 RepID=A0A255G3H1_9ACTN|nr:phospholipase D-like domain-containing protein [Enemella evansiae]PFG66455.1 cardiolipin synthase [Propionibacteriaceae bacterium ES.041]OYN94371.1 cardiolipin synthase A [Enemella evansiae]OYO06019.1 cardiolipin synthase A [Enemella evansiae]OYO07245.1 cardiolipin synthase A [Enemella evansiae]OYO08753.1 cardiolipin synthase A [Enemella evansiae]